MSTNKETPTSKMINDIGAIAMQVFKQEACAKDSGHALEVAAAQAMAEYKVMWHARIKELLIDTNNLIERLVVNGKNYKINYAVGLLECSPSQFEKELPSINIALVDAIKRSKDWNAKWWGNLRQIEFKIEECLNCIWSKEKVEIVHEEILQIATALLKHCEGLSELSGCVSYSFAGGHRLAQAHIESQCELMRKRSGQFAF